MTKILSAFALAAACLLLSGPAAAKGKELTPQQQKMKDCNAQAKGKAGDERKAFMKECLGGAKAEAKKELTPQQQKMKDCNAQAKGKKGAEHKAFMKECLSK